MKDVTVQLLTRPYRQMIGLARYTLSLEQALDGAGVTYALAQPSFPAPVRAVHGLLSRFGWDLRTFFTTYPVAANLDRHGLTHLTAQQMAFLLWLRPRLRPVIVTVHDIVPFLVRNDRKQTTFRHPLDVWFDNCAMHGLKRADFLISDSHFTKKTVVEALGYAGDHIEVVHLGVEHNTFYPQRVPESFYRTHGLQYDVRYVLYVGSENPRKNLPRLLQAFARVREEIADVRLIKIGSPEYLPEAEAIRQQVRELNLEEDVLFVEHVSDAELAHFYNLADLFVFPSLYEGFGLPPLEAMACGTPVVCSDAASLPEVVGDAAITVDPYNVGALAQAMVRILSDPILQRDLAVRGLARAGQFTWSRTAEETIAVYERVLGQPLN